MTAIASPEPIGAAPPAPFTEGALVRYGATLAGNVLRALCSFGAGVLVARGLGASEYGRLAFLLATFTAVRELFDAGASSAFYTLLSRRPRRAAYLGIYFGWLLVQLAAATAVIVLLPERAVGALWLGVPRTDLLLALTATFVTSQLWRAFEHLGEARRKTLVVQGATVAQAAAHLVLVAVAVTAGWLSVRTVLWLMLVEYAVISVVVAAPLLRANLSAEPATDDRPWADYAAYCRPLLVYGVLGFGYVFIDRWMLQRFGGSVEQAYLGVAQQFATVSLLATTSMMRVFWKEMADADERHDHARTESLYRSSLRGLYFATAWMSCLLVPYAKEILAWVLGPQYLAGWVCLSLLLLSPTNQTLGQVVGTYFHATGQTRRYAWTTGVTLVVSVPLSYLLLAPPTAAVPGLGLGALGLAIKILALEIIGVHVLQHMVTRAGGPSHEWREQAIVIGLLLGLAAIGRAAGSVVASWLPAPIESGGLVVIGATVYVGLSAVVVLKTRLAEGLPRRELAMLCGKLTTAFRY